MVTLRRRLNSGRPDCVYTGMARLLTLALLASVAAAETIPPGDYSDVGRVVRRANGQYDLFSGHGTPLQLTEKLAAQLKPFAGKLVRVEYTRVEETEGEIWDSVGAPIGKIRKITEVAAPALSLSIDLPQKSFALHEPVAVRVTVGGVANFDPNGIEIKLLHDYRTMLSFRPSEEWKRKRIPGQPMVRTIRADRMGKPGVYDVVAVMGATSGVPNISNMARVTIQLPKNLQEETAALKAWLPRAEPMQRIEIAGKLAERGDDSGVAAVMKLLQSKTRLYSNSPAYRLLWKHGGEQGEKLLMWRLEQVQDQQSVLRIMEDVGLSPRKLEYVTRWLADQRPTFRRVSGWCERPRVCDIAASWLMGYTNGAMRFPSNGTVFARDFAVAKVVAQLDENPAYFSVLKDG